MGWNSFHLTALWHMKILPGSTRQCTQSDHLPWKRGIAKLRKARRWQDPQNIRDTSRRICETFRFSGHKNSWLYSKFDNTSTSHLIMKGLFEAWWSAWWSAYISISRKMKIFWLCFKNKFLSCPLFKPLKITLWSLPWLRNTIMHNTVDTYTLCGPMC